MNAAPQLRFRWREWLLTAALVSLTAFLATYNLSVESFWADEVFTLGAVSLPWPEFWAKLQGDTVHPPWHYVAAKLSLAFGWDRLLAVRAPSIGAALATIFVICRLRRFDAALLLATNAFFIYYAQEARGYMFLYLGLAWLLFCLDRGKPAWQVSAAVVWMVWSHYFGVLYALTAVVFWRHRWKPILIGVVTLAPWLIYVSRRFITMEAIRQLGWIEPTSGNQFLLLYGRIFNGHPELYWGALGWLTVIGAWGLAMRREQLSPILWGALAILPPLGLFLLALVPVLDLRYFYFRYLLVSMIPACLLWPTIHAWARHAAIALALFVSLPFTWQMKQASARFDSIRVARDLQSESHPPVYVYDHPYVAQPINLYCQPQCIQNGWASPADIPPKFWWIAYLDREEIQDLDFRRSMRLLGYQSKSVRKYYRRPAFQERSLEILEWEKR
jgi:hypothetical protein